MTGIINVTTISHVEIEYDSVKNEKNVAQRGVSFELARKFEIDTAVIRMDVRKDYGELRFNALGYIGSRLYHMTFTVRGDIVRVISLRKANKREVNYYAKA